MKSGGKVAQTEVAAAAKSLRPTGREFYVLHVSFPAQPCHGLAQFLPSPTSGSGACSALGPMVWEWMS